MRNNRSLVFCVVFATVLGSSHPAAGSIIVTTAQELSAAVEQANGGGDKTILVEDGVYSLDNMLWIAAAGVTVAGRSGNRDAVILDGRGIEGDVTHIFNVAGANFTARDMTLRRVSQHAVQLQLDVDGVVLQNLHILDTGEQMVKVAYDPNNLGLTSDNGILEDCLLEYSEGIGPQWYIGGIDAHNATNWIVRNNIFRGIRSPSGAEAEHAIHFWSDSRNTLIERNLIINCDRGIGFGLGGRGHEGGTIRNNMLYHDASEGFADVGIGLESAHLAQVYNNTIWHEHSYPNAIEYRFASSHGILIANNLCNQAITARDGGSAELSHNLVEAQRTWFVDFSSGDLHLPSWLSTVVDQGTAIDGLSQDFDGDSRPQGSGVDIGADEYLGQSSANIFNRYVYADGARRPARTHQEERVIAGHRGEATILAFRLGLYGTAAANMPLLVQVHEWGGDFERQEQLAGYIPTEYDFVMLYFQYQPSDGNTDDWWFGTHWDGVCRMWAHQAIMDIVEEVLQSSLVSDHLPGAGIDPNRVYLFGHSIGGTGAWQLGIRNPQVFAAIHAHSGLARFTPLVGPFQQQFEEDIVGSENQGIIWLDDAQQPFPARDYSNLAWWLTNYRDAAAATPFVTMTAGTADDTTPAASGADLMGALFDQQKRGFYYHRHSGGHSEDCFVQMNWLWNFRLNQSFLAFTNRSGYGIGLDETVNPGDWQVCTAGGVNDLSERGWDPGSIIDQPDHYQVLLTGGGTADVTLRRLQRFRAKPRGFYRYWLVAKVGAGTSLNADSLGLITVPQVPGSRLLIIEPDPAGEPQAWHNILWQRQSDGLVSLWTLDPEDAFGREKLYGPFPGWVARDFHRNSDGSGNILWQRSSGGLVSLWALDAAGNFISEKLYGPFAGWQVRSFHRQPDGSGRILWQRSNDLLVNLWTVDAADRFVSEKLYGPFAGWQVKSFHHQADGTGRLLWQRQSDGLVSLWTLDGSEAFAGERLYGPFPNWSVKSQDETGNSTGRVLWQRTSDQLVSLWTLDATDGFAGEKLYGPFVGWTVCSYD